MAADGEDMSWMCGGVGMVNLHRVGSIVREIRDPCLHPSPPAISGSKMLKPEKWQTFFDRDGKIISFQKALKMIILGGVHPSIRAEVWEFLLGCYGLGSTTEYRKQLRIARRERYDDLVRKCRTMHSSIGTGKLAYVVGSKMMDMRTSSKANDIVDEFRESRRSSHGTNGVGLSNGHVTSPLTHQIESSCDPVELDGATLTSLNPIFDSPYTNPSRQYDCFSTTQDDEVHEPQYLRDSYFDFPPLPVTNLFQSAENDGHDIFESRSSAVAEQSEQSFRYEDDHMHGFHITNNVDLIMESSSSYIYHRENSEIEASCSENRLRISDVPNTAILSVNLSNGTMTNEDRVSEWLWTLHRIVVDVVRTDNHLEFYEDSKNLARMSDILAVYAWVDPSTGYCQGMSDLLSPFVVLYEDDADAFWCFEMLLRRMRENFQMEGPIGVMKQLQALWKILELTDAEIYDHLSYIGAESLHFAFRMLLVLFRRELSFNEALCMWEMMWAADFDETFARQLEENCLELLVVHIQENTNEEPQPECLESGKPNSRNTHLQHNKDASCPSYSNEVKYMANQPLCGLTRANFWPRQNQLQVCTVNASTRKRVYELPVFCVAAVLVSNRQKIMRQTYSIDDVIKMFNDNMLKINVKRCIQMAIKLRKKYFYKVVKQRSSVSDQLTEDN